ncbi:TonB C-terminal domain-containing protein [Xanthobacter versatilis]|uniref:TonB C-terminal domain-containing protein n=1 Tax=Xanthobacter autotrophicus (strain ATCC BAA-1158 / Py2) TaxID=78245 RepID=UPI003729FBE3
MTFTLGHGLAVSLALHGALILPFVVVRDAPPRQDDQLLVVELQGLISDTQSEQQVQQQSKGAPEQKPQEEAKEEQKTHQAQAAAPDNPEEDQAPDGTLAPAPPPAPEQKQEEAPPQEAARPQDAQAGTPGLADVVGAQEQKQAQRLEAPDEAELLKAYSRALTKKLKDNQAFPSAAQRTLRHPVSAYVTFAVEADGAIRSGSLKLARSTGLEAYDAATLRTVEKNAPFEPPPRPMSIGVTVDYFPN